MFDSNLHVKVVRKREMENVPNKKTTIVRLDLKMKYIRFTPWI